jgi:hypothetical protein
MTAGSPLPVVGVGFDDTGVFREAQRGFDFRDHAGRLEPAVRVDPEPGGELVEYDPAVGVIVVFDVRMA